MFSRYGNCKTTRGLTRRRVLSAGARGVGLGIAAALSGPAVISSSVLASDAQLNVLMWGDYVPQVWRDSFTQETGITLNLTPVGSGDDVLNKMKASRGEGIDLCGPSGTRSGDWADLGLLQSWDSARLPELPLLHEALLRVGTSTWNFNDRGPHWLPLVWGSEGIGWREDQWQPGAAGPSFGDIWDADNANKTMLRVHSGLLGAGLYLESIGEIEPGTIWAGYRNEAKMRRAWEEIIAFAATRKKQLGLIWTDTETQKDALINQGIVLGQVWEEAMRSLKSERQPVSYRAPVEGALAWVDGLSLSAQAQNLPEAYAFIRYCYQSENAGSAIREHGFNSALKGAEEHANENYREHFSAAYKAQDLERLNPWRWEPPWYTELRDEYIKRFTDAVG